jgi:rhodanese-related sulfurtransferase
VLSLAETESSEKPEFTRNGQVVEDHNSRGLHMAQWEDEADVSARPCLERTEWMVPEESDSVVIPEQGIWTNSDAAQQSLPKAMRVMDRPHVQMSNDDNGEGVNVISMSLIEDGFSDAEDSSRPLRKESGPECESSMPPLHIPDLSKASEPWATVETGRDTGPIRHGWAASIVYGPAAAGSETSEANEDYHNDCWAIRSKRAAPKCSTSQTVSEEPRPELPLEIAAKLARDTASRANHRFAIVEPEAITSRGNMSEPELQISSRQRMELTEQSLGLAGIQRQPLLLEPFELARYLQGIRDNAIDQQRAQALPMERKPSSLHQPTTSLPSSQPLRSSSFLNGSAQSEATSPARSTSTESRLLTTGGILMLDVRPPMSYEFEHIRHAEHLWIGPRAGTSDADCLRELVKAACQRLCGASRNLDLVIYDHCSESLERPQSIAVKLACALCCELPQHDKVGHRIWLLRGGFARMAQACPQEVERIHDGDDSDNLCTEMRLRAGPLFERLLHRLIRERSQPATLILPYLYVGSERDASNWSFLREARITHVLMVGHELKPHFPGAFAYKHIPVQDSVEEQLDRLYASIFAFIDESRRDSNSVILAHCYAGVSRSVTAVLAYLVHSGWTLAAAWELMRERRSVSRPNAGFWRQLISYECQRHGVQTLTQPPQLSSALPS